MKKGEGSNPKRPPPQARAYRLSGRFSRLEELAVFGHDVTQ